MGEFKMSVVGGRMNYKTLTSTLDERIFDIGKAHIWLKMINDRMRPTRWSKPSKKGSNVDFDMITSEEENLQALDELEMYIRQVNRKHGTDIELERHQRTPEGDQRPKAIEANEYAQAQPEAEQGLGD